MLKELASRWRNASWPPGPRVLDDMSNGVKCGQQSPKAQPKTSRRSNSSFSSSSSCAWSSWSWSWSRSSMATCDSELHAWTAKPWELISKRRCRRRCCRRCRRRCRPRHSSQQQSCCRFILLCDPSRPIVGRRLTSSRANVILEWLLRSWNSKLTSCNKNFPFHAGLQTTSNVRGSAAPIPALLFHRFREQLRRSNTCALP